MTPREIHYRVLILRERQKQLESELHVIEDEVDNHAQLQVLEAAERKMQEAANLLKNTLSTGPGLTLSLMQSIERINETRKGPNARNAQPLKPLIEDPEGA